MKFITLIPLLLCLSSPAYSKNSPFDRNVENTTFLNPACPATLTGVYADSKGKGRVSVHLVNQTEKRVIAVKVGFEGFDAALDKHEFPGTYTSALSLRPEREANPSGLLRMRPLLLIRYTGCSSRLILRCPSARPAWPG
jgi:hypothetical protein